MTTQNSSKEPETVVQQSILQQAQAAAANLASPAGQEALLQDIDLVNPEDDTPPPAYGDTYGEISNEKDAPGTSACVTDDGRVNIRINHLNRRLSQIFTPALRQEIAEDDRPPPPPYIPPSLGGEEGVPPPPPLNVVIQVVGSRGDVQPFVALGKVLKDTYGHRVRLATHPTFKDFVQENGLEFFSIGGDPSRLMAFMVKNPGLMPGFRSLLGGEVGQRRKDVAEYIQGCWRSCYQAGDGMDLDDNSEPSGNDPATRPFVADCIIANPPSFAHIHCAEKLGIPLHIMFTMPYSPTQAFPHPLANIQSSNADPQLTNYISYSMIELLSWQALGDIINRFRARCLGLDPVSMIWGPGVLQRLKIPHTYCWSPALIPKPKDWGSHISVSGFYLLNLASNYTPTPELQAFLDAGPPPIYIGFGSIVLDDPNAMTELIFEAVRKTGQRVLLSKGWGGMGADELRIPDNVFMLGNVPHDWLFKQVSCVVHHGGAGTTAAGITAGRPTLVIPFFGDQPFWGAMVARAGAGPNPIPHKQLTADKLADAINFCLKPSSLERARELATKMAAERGTDMGAQSFHQHLEPDRLRCTLAPSRPAAWRIKRTQIRLSAFAACTLANANLLDFRDLKLFRPQEHYTDEGPLEPISGGTMAFAGSVGSMLMGLVDFPSETLKALNMSSGPSRRQTTQTTMNREESLAHVRNTPRSSSSTSNIGSSSMSDGKDHDMLRQTGAHTSKGLGRIVKAIVQGPMDISVSFTKGLHNVPKLLGDDTVRPQEQVSDFKSGARAAGREFGLGWYDGVTGLFTQPWRGAQKEGVSGFFKGIGRGVGGFVAKPCAGVFGIPGYVMKGVHKEVQKLFGSNVQSYIIASRTAQGYDEWMKSSDAEKEDVIVRWKLIQKYLKKKLDPEMVRDLLEA
ncbi:Glyco-transf-28 domain-containing protein [Fusarium keratoplasticum]|uniref:Glyco-transf-28 domain-containing protein n=1 Tax=Fusarium keratoplasticum TaxID=1328300 RepID=A0ACC0RCG6_9HYPO|nr:Glyco-transf-28 domain-containing protein [Fusarium keratoplasticum]KAI8680445.1 Glyco-transf-28 domain-containing protein [Fusarium keratoplasticum]